MEELLKLLTRTARLKRFFQDRYVRWIVVFNIIFLYVWGYLLWGTTEVGSNEWFLEECGHLLWSSFHMWILIAYQKLHYAEEFEYWREREERLIWFRVVRFSVFYWEGTEFIRDYSGFFDTMAQLSNGDTMIDIFLSGLVGPLLSRSYWRWNDGMKLFFMDTNRKQTVERKLLLVKVLLSEIAEESVREGPEAKHQFHNLIKDTWQETHRVLPVLKVLYEVARGSRRERRRRRAYLRNLQLQKNN